MTDPYAAFDELRVERDTVDHRVIHIVLDGPNLNAVGPEAHR